MPGAASHSSSWFSLRRQSWSTLHRYAESGCARFDPGTRRYWRRHLRCIVLSSLRISPRAPATTISRSAPVEPAGNSCSAQQRRGRGCRGCRGLLSGIHLPRRLRRHRIAHLLVRRTREPCRAIARCQRRRQRFRRAVCWHAIHAILRQRVIVRAPGPIVKCGCSKPSAEGRAWPSEDPAQPPRPCW